MKFFITLITLCFAFQLSAQQSSISGSVTESFTKGVVVGAKIALESNIDGSVKLVRSNLDGQFIFENIDSGNYTATVTMLSFDTVTVELEIEAGFNTYDFIMGGGQELEEVQVIGNLAVDRKTPVAVTRISTKQLA